ncbi:MAG: tyrosine-type recombinase/integrase [Nocardioides sp.]|uniref:tyrosine-type recombinase/integrase n=1 Tax=Nocardioides sp. TaxID=35761 RepID=UPI0039E6059F
MADTTVTRSAYGTGTMYQRRSDWRWIAAVEADTFTAAGGRKRPTVSGKGCVGGCQQRCPHRAAIKRKLRNKRAELERDNGHVAKRTVTIAMYAEQWLQDIEPHVTPSAYTTDKAAVKAIVASIGKTRLNEVEPSHVKALDRYIRKQGNNSSTSQRYAGSLMRLLKAAAQDGYTIRPNVLHTKKPKAAVNDRDAVPVDEAIRVLTYLAELPTEEDLVRRGGVSRWALTFLQGHRSAESRGLTWPMVDLEVESLTIAWQIQGLKYIENRNPAAGFRVPDGYEAVRVVGAQHLVRPKSEAGWRVQPLVPWAANSLRAWREIAPDNPQQLVWPGRSTKAGTWPRNPASDLDEWHDIQKAVGIAHPTGRPWHLHEIRHGTATLLMALGVPESVRIAIMGHSSIASTRDYEHVDLTEARRALEKVAARLELVQSN